MKLRIIALATAALLAAPAISFAQDNSDDRWSGTGELGLAIAKGNTDSQTCVGKLKPAKDTG